MAVSDDYLQIGRIVAAHGIKGWLKLKSFTQPETNLLNYKTFFIGQDGWKPIEIEQGSQQGKLLLVKFAGIDDRNEAEKLIKCDVAIKVAELPELPLNEYYWYQLEGLKVWAGDKLLGKVSHLLETGSNDVLVVHACEGSLDNRERLIPWRPEVISSVDLAGGEIRADWDPDF